MLFDVRTPVLFVLGALLLEVVGSATYDLILALLGESWQASLGALLIGLLLLAFVTGAIVAVLGSHRDPLSTLGMEERAHPREGVVVFLSTGSGKADEEALRFHKQGGLRYVWLVASPEVEAEGKVERLVAEYRDQGVVVDPRPLTRPRDAGEAYSLIHSVLQDAARQGLGAGQLYVDITGSMRPSAVGATLACYHLGHDLEYVICRYDGGRCVPGTSEVMEVRLGSTPDHRQVHARGAEEVG